MTFTDSELQALAITERVSSTISLIGCIFVIVTFLCSDRFRTPVNRLIFYATLGNILGIAATLTSRSGILAGTESSLCQWQAVFIQWFHPADALWAFCMACNVYLTLFHRYSTAELRKLEWKYFCACYTLTFIPAFAFLFIEDESRGKVYGGAVQDVQQDTQQVGPQPYHLDNLPEYHPENQRQHLGDDLSPTYFPPSTPRDTTHGPDSTGMTDGIDIEDAPGYPGLQITPSGRHTSPGDTFRRRKASWERQSAAWAYSKFAILFFISLLITWLPATINRVYAFAHPEGPSRVLTYIAALVLPLQGFWNTLVYTAVSTSTLDSLIAAFEENPRRFLQFPGFRRSLGRLYSFISRPFRRET
ncbi:putative cAMP receptor-like protein [Arthroderma uncinatum]|uniref:putative cAMP receptor-like protein n=1 Tax=Arthroderma uncinatum TaxID=74035 RepID=UPI00144AEB7A|nr:putative cAMP receptor-like protein [Arthroderma uncinatum]KAF3482382.1 putative cAMP receptor-like protein [Arthroderma uncinatum]